MSSRSNSESSRKRERDNDEVFKLPTPIRETDREKNLKKTVNKMKEKEKKDASDMKTKDKRIEELER